MTRCLRGVAACLAACAVLLPAYAWGSTLEPALPAIGGPAPSFLYTDFETGVAMPFEGFERNRPIVLVFLQTACRSCNREMAVLKRLQEETASFGVLAVFLDMTPRNLKKYVEDNDLPFTFTWDSTNAIAGAYGVTFTPASFLLDGKRQVVKIYRGFHPGVERSLQTDLKGLAAR